MELSLPAFLLFLGVPVLLGCALLRCAGIGPRTDALAYPGWVWMCGALAVAALEVVRLLAGLASPAAVVGGALALSPALFLASRARAPLLDETLRARRAGWSRVERTVLGAVLTFVVLAALHQGLEASLNVIHANDEAGFWSKRAKYLFEARGFGGAYAEAIHERLFPNATYPLLNSLLQLWVFDCAGEITHVANRFPIQLCTLALLLCTAAACRRAGRPWVAAVLLVLLAASNPTSIALTQANSDVLVALGALVAVDAFQRGVDARARGWAWLGSLGATFALWSKKEGLLLVLAGLASLALWARWRRRGEIGRVLRALRTRAGLLLVLPGLAVVGTLLHNLLLGAEGSHSIRPASLAAAWSRREELPLVLETFLRFATRRMNGLPLAFLVLALVLWPRRSGALAFLPLAWLFFVTGLVVAVLPSAGYLLRTAALRVLSQALPLQALWLAAVTPQLLEALRRRPPDLDPARGG